MISSIVYVAGVIIAVILLAKLANARQHMWQEKADENKLIDDTNKFLAGWGRYEEKTAARYDAVTSEAERFAEAERRHTFQRQEEWDAVSDEALIAESLPAIRRSAIYNGPADEPLKHDRLAQDKAMFKAVEATKARRGILSMSDELHG